MIIATDFQTYLRNSPGNDAATRFHICRLQLNKADIRDSLVH